MGRQCDYIQLLCFQIIIGFDLSVSYLVSLSLQVLLCQELRTNKRKVLIIKNCSFMNGVWNWTTCSAPILLAFCFDDYQFCKLETTEEGVSSIYENYSASFLTCFHIVTSEGLVSFNKKHSSFRLWREACGSQVLLRWLADKQFKVSFWEVCVH